MTMTVEEMRQKALARGESSDQANKEGRFDSVAAALALSSEMWNMGAAILEHVQALRPPEPYKPGSDEVRDIASELLDKFTEAVRHIRLRDGGVYVGEIETLLAKAEEVLNG